MRLHRHHAWGAFLLVLFALPLIKPKGFDLVERPVGSVATWFAEVPGLNPRLLKSSSNAKSGDDERTKTLERALQQLWHHLQRVRSQVAKAGELNTTLSRSDLDRRPLVVAARVLRAHDPVPRRRSILIDVGADDGVVEGQPVVFGSTYFGRVRVVRAHSAQVQLITDPYSRLEVLIPTTSGEMVRGYARRLGRRDGTDVLSIDFTRMRRSFGSIPESAPVFTANFDERVPAHLLVGRIVEMTDADRDGIPSILVEPAMDLDTATDVFVLKTRSPMAREKGLARPASNDKRQPPLSRSATRRRKQ